MTYFTQTILWIMYINTYNIHTTLIFGSDGRHKNELTYIFAIFATVQHEIVLGNGICVLFLVFCFGIYLWKRSMYKCDCVTLMTWIYFWTWALNLLVMTRVQEATGPFWRILHFHCPAWRGCTFSILRLLLVVLMTLASYPSSSMHNVEHCGPRKPPGPKYCRDANGSDVKQFIRADFSM